MKNNINKLKQVRDALAYSRERAYMQNAKRFNFSKSESLERDDGIQKIEKALVTLDTIIADCSALDELNAVSCGVTALEWFEKYSGNKNSTVAQSLTLATEAKQLRKERDELARALKEYYIMYGDRSIISSVDDLLEKAGILND